MLAGPRGRGQPPTSEWKEEDVEFIKSSHSGNGGNCVEVAVTETQSAA